MSDATGTRWPVRACLVLACAAAFAACLIANYPGHFTPDSLWQLAQGRAGRYNDWHPPVMAWLLGLADRARPGAGLFMIGDAALFNGGLLAFAMLRPNPRPLGLLAVLVWVFSPLALVFQGLVLKDVLFADCALAGFAAMGWAGALWERLAPRLCLLLLAACLFAIAELARQNGVIVAVVGAGAFGVMAYVRVGGRGARWARLARAAGMGGAGLAVTLAIAAAGEGQLRRHAEGPPEGPHHLKILQVWDLAGALNRDPGLDLPILARRQPAEEAFLRRTAAARYTASGSDNIASLPLGDGATTPVKSGSAVSDGTNPPGGAVGAQWAALIGGRPDLYLSVRWRVWLDTFLTPAAARCPMVFTGVDGENPAMNARAGLAVRDDDRDDWDDDYASAFLNTPVFSHLFYAVLIMVVLARAVWRWRRGERDPGLIATGALCIAGMVFAASFFVISIDCDYRFLYFLDVAAMAAVVSEACARAPRRVAPDRPGGSQGSPA